MTHRHRPGPGRRSGLALLLGIGLLLSAGCASAPPGAGGNPLASRPRIALLPLENLTTKAEAGEVLSRIVMMSLSRSAQCQVVEPGDVNAALDLLGIRYTGSVSRDQLQALAGKIGMDFLMVGSVLETGKVRTAYAEVPSVGLALRVLDVTTGRVVWADMRFRDGADGETLFGWGRQTNEQKLADGLVRSMLKDFRLPPPAGSPSDQGGPR